MMTNLSRATDTAALKNALRACQEASERLNTVLSSQMSESSSSDSAAGSPSTFNWSKAPDAFVFDDGSRFAKTPSTMQNTTCVYVAGCPGLRSLSAELQLPLFKIGSSGTDVLNRLVQLNADRYAAGFRVDDKIIVESGFDRWKFMTMDYTLPRSPDSPVRIEPRALRVKLSASMSRRQFEAQLRTELAPISLAHWLKTEGSQIYLKTRGVTQARVERYTPYDLGDSMRLSPADEVYIFRHRIDMGRLCRLIELIVQDAAQA